MFFFNDSWKCCIVQKIEVNRLMASFSFRLLGLSPGGMFSLTQKLVMVGSFWVLNILSWFGDLSLCCYSGDCLTTLPAVFQYYGFNTLVLVVPFQKREGEDRGFLMFWKWVSGIWHSEMSLLLLQKRCL